jgi:hypothetical protein
MSAIFITVILGAIDVNIITIGTCQNVLVGTMVCSLVAIVLFCSSV